MTWTGISEAFFSSPYFVRSRSSGTKLGQCRLLCFQWVAYGSLHCANKRQILEVRKWLDTDSFLLLYTHHTMHPMVGITNYNDWQAMLLVPTGKSRSSMIHAYKLHAMLSPRNLPGCFEIHIFAQMMFHGIGPCIKLANWIGREKNKEVIVRGHRS